jgi:hypothetical protein
MANGASGQEEGRVHAVERECELCERLQGQPQGRLRAVEAAIDSEHGVVA